MRLTPISVVAAMVLSLAGPALAQEAGDCDMLCRLRGYLSADHMSAGPAEEGPARATAKARHPRAAAHPAADRAVPSHPQAIRPVVAAAKTPSPPQAAPARAVAKIVQAKPPEAAPAPAARPQPPTHAASAKPRAMATAEPAVEHAVRPRPSASKPGVPRIVAVQARAAALPPAAPNPLRQARTDRAAKPTRTASLGTTIPGSAPAVQAGFH